MFHSSKNLLLTCVIIVLALAWTAEAQPPSSPKTCNVGSYLISLHDFDLTDKSFAADFWFWSTCPEKHLRPLQVMDFVNAKKITSSLDAIYERGDLYWSYVKVSGVFHHDWDIRNFPFDRHVLKIITENTNASASSFVYTPDRDGSKASRDIQLEGWEITDFRIEDHVYLYDTTFGDPAFSGSDTSDYARLILTIALSRDSLLSFFKLSSGVYAAFALSLLSFFLNASQTAARIGLLVGTLFAVLVNQRESESVLGRTEALTLVDQIHITAMVYIFAGTVMAIHSRWLSEAGREELAHRRDRIGFWVASVSFVIVNGIIVAAAAATG
jgi:hypothetical protein